MGWALQGRKGHKCGEHSSKWEGHLRPVFRHSSPLPIFIQKHYQCILSKTKLWSWKHHDRHLSLTYLPTRKPHMFRCDLPGPEVSGCHGLCSPIPSSSPSSLSACQTGPMATLVTCRIVLLMFTGWKKYLAFHSYTRRVSILPLKD